MQESPQGARVPELVTKGGARRIQEGVARNLGSRSGRVRPRPPLGLGQAKPDPALWPDEVYLRDALVGDAGNCGTM